MTTASSGADPASGGGRPLPRNGLATTGGIGAALAGGWLMIGPSVLGFDVTARWNGLLIGALVLSFGTFLGLLGARSIRLTAPLALLGGWLMTASFLLPYGEAASWNSRVVGALILAVALALTTGPATRTGRVPRSGHRRFLG